MIDIQDKFGSFTEMINGVSSEYSKYLCFGSITIEELTPWGMIAKGKGINSAVNRDTLDRTDELYDVEIVAKF